MENTSFQEPGPRKPGDQASANTPGPPVSQPPPAAPEDTVQQTLICQPTKTAVVEVNRKTASTEPRYNHYLCWSILNLLFCCFPLGIAAIVFSCKTRSNIKAHDHEAAAKNSRKTYTLNVSALVIGFTITFMFAVFYFIGY